MKLVPEKILAGSIVIALTGLGVIMFLLFQKAGKIHDITLRTTQSNQVVYHADRILDFCMQNDALIRAYAATGFIDDASNLSLSEKLLQKEYADLVTISSLNTELHKWVQSLSVLIDSQIRKSQQVVHIREQNGQAAAMRFVHARSNDRNFSLIRSAIEEIKVAENNLLQKEKQDNQHAVYQLNYLLSFLTAFTIVFFLLVFYIFKREYQVRKKHMDENAFLSTLISHVNDAIFSTDAFFRINTWSKGAEVIYGWKEKEAIGRKADELLQTDYGNASRENLIKSFSDTGYFKREVKQKTRSGKMLFILVSSSALYNKDGSFRGAVTVNTDITELKKLQEALWQSNQELALKVDAKTAQYSAMLERITDAFIAMDRNGCILFMNYRAGEIFNRTPDSLIGQHFWTELPEMVDQSFYNAYHQAVKSNQYVLSADFLHSPGLWLEAHIYPSREGVSVFFNNITERKKTRLYLEDLNQKLLAAQKIARLGYWEMDLQSGIPFWSDEIYTIWGVAKDNFELTYQSFYETIYPDDRQLFDLHYQDLLLRKQPLDIEYRIAFPDGSIRFVHTQGNLVYNEIGESIAVKGTVQDITDRKLTEQTIRDSEEKRRLIMNASLDAIICMDTKGYITFWNPQAEKIFGRSEPEVVGQLLADTIIPERYRKRHTDALERFLATGESKRQNSLQELSAIDKEGKEFPVELMILLIKQDSDEFFCAFLRDITKRKEDNAALILSKQRADIVSKATNDSIWDWDFETNTVFREHNKLETLFGYAPFEESEVDALWNKYAHPDDWKSIQTQRNAIFKDPEQNYWEGEYRFLKTDGTYAFVHDRGYIIRDQDGKVIRMIGASQDISRRKLAERELLAQKYFFQQMFEQSSVSTQILDKEGWCERINPKLSEIFGVAPEQIEGRKYNIFKDEELRKSHILPILEKVFREGKTAEWEIHFDIGVAADSQNITVAEKKKVWYQNWAYPIFDAQGNLQHVIIQHTDISARKQAEASLRNSELRFRSLVEKGSEVIALHDKEGIILYMSPAVKTLLGYQPEERVGRSGLEKVHPEDKPPILQTLSGLLAKPGSVATAQWRHLHADGSWHWMDGIATNLLNDPSVGAVVHNFRDITEQKMAEQKIILEKELSASIINSLPGIFYLYDESLRFLRWNDNFLLVTGYTVEELERMSPLDFFEGQEKLLLKEKIEEVFTRGKAEVEANLYTSDKRKIPYFFTGWAAEFEGRKCLIGMGIDITTRRQNEAQLKLLESVVTYASDSIIITEAEHIDKDGPKIMYVNQAFCEMTGYSPEELIGATPRILQGPDTDRKELDKLRKALESWKPFNTEIINYKKDGESFWVQISLTPVANQDGWYTHWIAVENDISDRKLAEQELKSKNKELQKLSNYLKNVREEERKYLAREVHDELGQLASALKIDIDWLSQKLPKEELNIEKRVHHANLTIQVLITTIRKIAASLRPSVLDDFGLKVALEMHCQEFSRLNDIETIFTSNIQDVNLSIEQKTELFRMTQESLTNVMRHAKAKRVHISLLEDDSVIRLTIEDDGIGFDSNLKKNTLGLVGLRERAVSLLGELKIQSEPGKGTVVFVVIPKTMPPDIVGGPLPV